MVNVDKNEATNWLADRYKGCANTGPAENIPRFETGGPVYKNNHSSPAYNLGQISNFPKMPKCLVSNLISTKLSKVDIITIFDQLEKTT